MHHPAFPPLLDHCKKMENTERSAMKYMLGIVICISGAFVQDARSSYAGSNAKNASCDRYKEISDSLFDNHSNEVTIILKYIEEVLTVEPDCIKALADKAYIFYFLDEFEMVLGPASIILELEPNDYEANAFIAHSYYHLGLLDKAEKGYDRLIEAIPDSTHMRIHRAEVYIDQKKYGSASQDLLLAKDDWEHRSAKFNLLMAILADVSRQHKESIMYLDRAFQLGYDHCQGYYLRGVNYYHISDYEEATLDLNKAVHGYTDSCLGGFLGKANFFLGQSYFKLAQYEKAMPYLIKAHGIGNLDEVGYYSLGYSLLNSGEVAQAEKVFKEALELFPFEGSIPSGMADVMVAKGEEDKARDYLTIAVEKGSRFVDDSVTYYTDICDRLLGLHDTLAAFHSIDKGLQLLPGSDLLHRYKLVFIVRANDANGPDVLRVLGDLIQLYAAKGQRDKQAYYMVYKALWEMKLGLHESSLASVSDAIELDDYPEYYAIRSLAKFWYHRQVVLGGGDDNWNISTQDVILDDVRVSMSSGHKTKEILLLKMGYLVLFHRLEEACTAAKEALHNGGHISDVQLSYLCGEISEIDEDDTLGISYELTSFEERFEK